jgi:eukaryotic-like serine/threonine-protein kinase
MVQNAERPRSEPDERVVSGTARLGTASRHSQLNDARPSELAAGTRLLSGRFVVRSRLGAGGMGTVYRATDTRIGAEVALKVLHRSGAWAVYSIKREFRALASMVHPNLIGLHELYCDDSEDGSLWFFTMPLIEGLDFAKRVRGRVDEHGAASCDYVALRALLPQLLSGIHALHTTGKLHRDLKPSNILVDRSDRVVILDFGVVRDLLTDAAASPEAELGTPAYMAPELRFGGVSASPESDWYSLGVVLFEAITGALPRPGLQQAPSAFSQGVPADLDRLCVALLQLEPAQRPTAVDVAREIGAQLEPPVVESYEPFVGRQPDLERMRAALRDLEASVPSLFEIVGASGMGKSSLCRQFVQEAQAQHGAWVLRGRCYEREAVPFKAVDAIVDQISEELTGFPLQSPPFGQDWAAAVRIFPVLGRVGPLPESRRGRPESALRARESGFEALACLIEALARGRPVVIAIDDVQWADSDSAKLLATLLGRVRCKLLLALTHRGDASGAESFLQVLDERLQAAQTRIDRQHVQLDALSDAEARALAASLMPHADDDRLTRVVGESRGLPMFLCELSRGDPSTASTGVPLSIGNAFEQRISLLPPSARSLLEVLAVASRPLERDLALGAAHVPLEDSAIVHALSVARLATTRVDMPTTRLETYHDKIREGILERMPDSRLREIHEHLVDALERAGSSDSESLFTHYFGAGRLAEARVAALEAADYADRTLAFGRAASLYEQALALDEQASDRWLVNEKMGDALVHARRGATAGEAFDRAVALYRETASPEPGKLLSLRNRAAEQHLQSADTQRGVAVIKAVLLDHGIEFPRSNARATATILANRVRLVLKGFEPPRENRADAALEARMESLWIASKSLCFVSTIPATLFSGMLTLTAFESGHARYLVRGLCMVASQEAMMELDFLYRRADKLCDTVLRLARDSGDPYEMGFYHLCRAAIGWFQGKFQLALEHSESAEELFSKLDRGSSYERAVTHLWGLHALAMTGNLKKLKQRTQEVRREAHERNDVFGERNAVLGQSTLATLADGEAELALTRAEAVMRQTSTEFMGHDYHLLVTRVYVAWYQGEYRSAWEHVVRAWPGVQSAMFDKLACMRDELLNLRAHAALALAKVLRPGETVIGLRGQRWARGELIKMARRDARAIASHRLPHCAPYASLLGASAAALAGDQQGSARLLSEAVSGFDRAGMALHREVSRFAASPGAGTGWFEEQGVVEPVRFLRALLPSLV